MHLVLALTYFFSFSFFLVHSACFFFPRNGNRNFKNVSKIERIALFAFFLVSPVPFSAPFVLVLCFRCTTLICVLVCVCVCVCVCARVSVLSLRMPHGQKTRAHTHIHAVFYSNIMMSCNTPSIDQTNEAVELSFFFSMDIQFSSHLSLICGAWDGP